jgi:catechol 2,3-dioxygenase-like lactoylglutathione lyase family enzyme
MLVCEASTGKNTAEVVRLGVEAKAFDTWRRHLQGHRVIIEKEVEWPKGGKSIYFRDPAGNLVELVTPGV